MNIPILSTENLKNVENIFLDMNISLFLEIGKRPGLPGQSLYCIDKNGQYS